MPQIQIIKTESVEGECIPKTDKTFYITPSATISEQFTATHIHSGLCLPIGSQNKAHIKRVVQKWWGQLDSETKSILKYWTFQMPVGREDRNRFFRIEKQLRKVQ